jgi:hypothetical protein
MYTYNRNSQLGERGVVTAWARVMRNWSHQSDKIVVNPV